MWTIERVVSKGDYNYAVVLNHPNRTVNNYVLHHRIIMENHIGRLLTVHEIVHHINEDKKDNRIANLEILSPSEHARLHKAIGRTTIELICHYCDKVFIREVRQVKPYFHNFCSRRCNGKNRKQ